MMASRPPTSLFRTLIRGLLEPGPGGGSCTGSFSRANFILVTTQRSFRATWSVAKVQAWALNFQHGLKIMGSFVGKQCSPIFAQRVTRTFRVLQLHSKLWSSQGFRPLGRKALLSFLLVSICEANPGIGDSILQSELVE